MALKIKIIRKEDVKDIQADIDNLISTENIGVSQIKHVTTSSDQYGTNVVITYDDGKT